MNSARLLRVADHLDTLDRKDFNFRDNEKCALGHATRLPYFKRIGLKYDPVCDIIRFKEAIQRKAAMDAFDLTMLEAGALFCGYARNSLYKSSNPTPKQVAKGIRNFVKTNE